VGESETHSGGEEAECSCLPRAVSNSLVFKMCLKLPRNLAGLHLYNIEFETEDALTKKILKISPHLQKFFCTSYCFIDNSIDVLNAGL